MARTREAVAGYNRAYSAAHRGERAARNAAYRADHREEAKAYNAAWYATYGAAYRAAHRENLAARNAAYHATNPEKKATYDATYRAAHREERAAYNAAWQVNNPDRVAANSHRRRGLKVGAAGTFTAGDLSARWAMWGDKCWICGAAATATDHVKPLVRGGSNWPANLRPACGPCNSSKNAKWPLSMFMNLISTKEEAD